MNNKFNSKYSVIFEDDVKFDSNLKVDIDLIFFGNGTKKYGNKLINNIYNLDNNQNIKKIYDLNCKISHEVDSHYVNLIKNFQLKGYIIYTPLCLQNWSMPSNIKC